MEPYKLDLLKYRIERSKETVEEAEFALNHNKLKLAENRIYYAIVGQAKMSKKCLTTLARSHAPTALIQGPQKVFKMSQTKGGKNV